MSIRLQLENLLQAVDRFFAGKSQKDKNMVYIMIIALAFGVAYPFYDLSLDDFTAESKKVSEIQGKINGDKAYLQANSAQKVALLNQEILKANEEFVKTSEANRIIKDRIMAIDSLVYDEKLWGAYLDSISKNAQKHNVKINTFSNKLVESKEAFGHVLDIDLDIVASYTDTLGFINSLEQSELVVDLHNFSINAKDKLESKLNISVWGITYR
jgi:Tfp pilus assembly protein PilO